MKKSIVVIVGSGMVQQVRSNFDDLEVITIDLDTEGKPDEKIKTIKKEMSEVIKKHEHIKY